MHWLFLQYHITDPNHPIKWLWLGLTYLSILLKLCSLRLKLPGFTSHLTICCVSAALQSTHLWAIYGAWGEALFTLTALAFSWELHFTSCAPVQYQTEKKYILGYVTAIGVSAVGLGILTGITNPHSWPAWLFRLHFYTVCGCLGASIATVWVHYRRRTQPNPHILPWPAVLWFGASVWSGVMYWSGSEFFTVGCTAVLIQIGCLVTWVGDWSRRRLGDAQSQRSGTGYREESLD